jgi:hypothetical protein
MALAWKALKIREKAQRFLKQVAFGTTDRQCDDQRQP